jgi:hypothetical protein
MLRPNCAFVTTVLAPTAVGTGARFSLTLTLKLSSDIHWSVPWNGAISIASHAISLASQASNSWGYACTQ